MQSPIENNKGDNSNTENSINSSNNTIIARSENQVEHQLHGINVDLQSERGPNIDLQTERNDPESEKTTHHDESEIDYSVSQSESLTQSKMDDEIPEELEEATDEDDETQGDVPNLGVVGVENSYDVILMNDIRHLNVESTSQIIVSESSAVSNFNNPTSTKTISNENVDRITQFNNQLIQSSTCLTSQGSPSVIRNTSDDCIPSQTPKSNENEHINNIRTSSFQGDISEVHSPNEMTTSTDLARQSETSFPVVIDSSQSTSNLLNSSDDMIIQLDNDGDLIPSPVDDTDDCIPPLLDNNNDHIHHTIFDYNNDHVHLPLEDNNDNTPSTVNDNNDHISSRLYNDNIHPPLDATIRISSSYSSNLRMSSDAGHQSSNFSTITDLDLPISSSLHSPYSISRINLNNNSYNTRRSSILGSDYEVLDTNSLSELPIIDRLNNSDAFTSNSSISLQQRVNGSASQRRVLSVRNSTAIDELSVTNEYSRSYSSANNMINNGVNNLLPTPSTHQNTECHSRIINSATSRLSGILSEVTRPTHPPSYESLLLDANQQQIHFRSNNSQHDPVSRDVVRISEQPARNPSSRSERVRRHIRHDERRPSSFNGCYLQRPRSNFHPRPHSNRNNTPRTHRPLNRFQIQQQVWTTGTMTHLPPTSPDCQPGCGYTGLPCYNCSVKRLSNGSYKNLHRARRRRDDFMSPWFLFRHQNRVYTDANNIPLQNSSFSRRVHARYFGPPPSYGTLFPRNLCERCYRRINTITGCPQSRSNWIPVLWLMVMIYLIVMINLMISGINNKKRDISPTSSI